MSYVKKLDINGTSYDIKSLAIEDVNIGSALKLWTGTREEYDLIENKDPYTLYNLTDDTGSDNPLEGYADTDLSNLTEKGTSRFQHAHFSINNGTVGVNGNNETLHAPVGSQTQVEEQFIPEPMTSAADNGTMGGDKFAVAATGTWSSPYYDPWKVFNTGNGGFADAWASTSIPCRFDIYNPEPIKITNIKIRNFIQATYSIKQGTVSGSNDYSNWTSLTTFTNSTVAAQAEWNIDLSSNTNSYKYYRINITEGNPSASIQRMEITATKVISVASGTSVICDPCTVTTATGETKTFEYPAAIDLSSATDGNYLLYRDSVTSNLVTGSYRVNNDGETPFNSFNIVTKGVVNLSNSGVLSNFSDSKYAILPILFNPSSSNWEFNLNFKTATDISSLQAIYEETNCLYIYVNSGNLYVSLGNGSTYSIYSGTSIVALEANTLYNLNITFTGTSYTIKVDDVIKATFASSTPIGSAVGYFGKGNFKGYIDLYNSYIKVGDSYIWRGIPQNNYALMGYATVSSGVVTAIKNTTFNENGRFLIYSYAYGTSWCRVYSDGWCEQGGVVSIANGYQLYFLKEFKDTNYQGHITERVASAFAQGQQNCRFYPTATNYATCCSGSVSGILCQWIACGYVRESVNAYDTSINIGGAII